MQDPRMQTFVASKHNFHIFNSLACLVKALQGHHTVIDLRNESCVSGLIKQVDGFMNVEMENAVFYDQLGGEHKFAVFYVKNRNIRYVHIPSSVSTIQLMEQQLGGMVYKKAKQKDNFKTKRAKKYTAAILKEQEAQPSTSK